MAVINAFIELGLPFIKRFVDDWRAGKTTIKQAMSHVQDEPPPTTEDDAEKRFLDKVEREVGLPDYSLFSESLLQGSTYIQPIMPRWSRNSVMLPCGASFGLWHQYLYSSTTTWSSAVTRSRSVKMCDGPSETVWRASAHG